MANNYSVNKIDIEYINSFKPFIQAFEKLDSAFITNFREESSTHRPRSSAKLAYNSSGLIGFFNVEDKFVISRNTAYNSMVCRDSCVEFFCKPKKSSGYFNFEFNCSGVLRASYIVDPERDGDGFKDWTLISEELGNEIVVDAFLKESIDDEIIEPINWNLWFYIPFNVLENYIGKIDIEKSRDWKGNFYKCADKSSHPHWGSWNLVSELNFHAPHDFGILNFN